MAAWWKAGLLGLGLGLTAPAPVLAEADPGRDNIVLGALIAEFHLAIAVSLLAPDTEADHAPEVIAGAAQLARLTGAAAPQAGADKADLAAALGAFLAFAATLPAEAKAPLSPTQARDFACQLIGAEPIPFAALGRVAGIDTAAAGKCAKAFDAAAAKWNERFSTYRLGPGLSPPAESGPLYVEIAPVFNPANEPIAETLRESGLYDALAERLNAEMALPTGRVLLVTECGGTRAFFNPERREVVLCDERIAAWIAAAAATTAGAP